MPYSKTVVGDNYSYKVSAISDGTIGGGRSFYACYGATLPDILILKQSSGILAELLTKEYFAYSQFYDLFYDHSPTNQNISTWKDRLNRCSVWLNGSLEDGGICFFRSSASEYGILGNNGLYVNNTTGNQQYHLCFTRQRLLFSDEIQFTINYLYNTDEVYQNSLQVLTYNVTTALSHREAVWTDPLTAPSYVTTGNVYSLQYLDNGGFRQRTGYNFHYPNSCIGAITDSTTLTYGYDDEINEQLTTTHTHVQGTLFNGAVTEDKNDLGGHGGNQGGDGTYGNDQNGQNPVCASDTGILETGILSLFIPTANDLGNFARFLYSSLTDADALALKKLFANPMDYIVSLNMCHLNLSNIITGSKTVQFGGVDSTIAMDYTERQIVCGSGGTLTLPMECQNFLDFAPYTRAKIYVPYCGEYDLPIDWCIGGTLKLSYNIDLLSGSLTAQLSMTRDRTNMFAKSLNIENAVNDLVLTTYTGNCFISIPIGSVDNRNLVSSLLGVAGATATSIATANPLPVGGAIANATMNSKPTVSRAGSIGSCFGYMLPQFAQVTIERPIQNIPYEFSSYKGYPSNHIAKIGSFHGFTICDTDTFWSDNFSKPITTDETNEIKSLLNTGIWLD